METFKIISYIVAIILFATILRWDVFSDFGVSGWSKKKLFKYIPIKHGKEGLLRASLLVPVIALLLWPKLYTNIWQWYSLLILIVDIALVFSVWWELFDGWYNSLRGKKWRYNGTVDKDDSFLDRFLYNIGDTWEGVLKISLISISLVIYIFFI